MGLDTINMVVCFDKDWIATSGMDMFYGKPLVEVMNWINANIDAFQHNYTMEVIFLPQRNYRVIFSFVS
jgi:hypothetical protein